MLSPHAQVPVCSQSILQSCVRSRNSKATLGGSKHTDATTAFFFFFPFALIQLKVAANPTLRRKKSRHQEEVKKNHWHYLVLEIRHHENTNTAPTLENGDYFLKVFVL